MKLYAIFDPKGNLAYGALRSSAVPIGDHMLTAWEEFGVLPGDYATLECLKRHGYTCEEVEIRKVQK